MEKVSVHVITYNQEKYLSQTIEGILNQRTDFDFKIYISDDCSKDSTLEIALDYQLKYPDKIEVFSNEINLGSIENFANLFKYCKGEYIAICEGDDYWCDQNKLQMQYDELQINKDVIASLHNAWVSIGGVNTSKLTHADMSNVINTSELLNSNSFAMATIFFRKTDVISMVDFLKKSPFGDWALLIWLSNKGRISYFDKCLSVYRVHDEGIWNSRKSLDKITSTLSFYKFISRSLVLSIEEQKIILKRNQYLNMKLFGYYLGNLKILNACNCGVIIIRDYGITEILKKQNAKALIEGFKIGKK